MRLPVFHNLAAGDRRALLIGLAAAAPMAFWMLVATPYLHAVQEAKSRIEASRDLLARERQLLAGAKSYPVALGQGKARLDSVGDRLFEGGNEAAVATALATHLREQARASRVLLSELKSAPAESVPGGMSAVPLNVTGESDLEGLLTFLRALESGRKLVHVDQLEVEAVPPVGPASQSAQAAQAALSAGGPEVLSFRLTVKGFSLGAVAAARPEGSP